MIKMVGLVITVVLTAASAPALAQNTEDVMAMWSYKVKDLDAILARAEAEGVPVHAGPKTYTSPSLGAHRAVTLLAPSGFMIEVFEPQ